MSQSQSHVCAHLVVAADYEILGDYVMNKFIKLFKKDKDEFGYLSRLT